MGKSAQKIAPPIQEVDAKANEILVVACIPAYRDEDHIAKVVLGARRFVDRVIVCDDGSGDSTSEIALALGAFVVKHEQSAGYNATIISLFKNARNSGAAFVVEIDGLCQYDPSEIPMLLDRLIEKDVDIVIGLGSMNGGDSNETQVDDGEPKFNDQHFGDTRSGFRAFRGTAIETLKLTEASIELDADLFRRASEAGLKVVVVPVHMRNVVGTPIPAMVRLESSAPVESVVEAPVKVMAEVEAVSGVTPAGGKDVSPESSRNLFLRSPLLFFGVPGVVAMLVSLGFWAMLVSSYFDTGFISTNLMLLGFGTMLSGLILVVASIILWSIGSIDRLHARA